MHLSDNAFHDWCMQEFPDLKHGTRNNIMQVSKRFGGSQNFNYHFPISVLYELAAPSVPDELVEDIMSLYNSKMVGFFGKFFAFIPAIEAGMVWLVVLALIASVIGAFYYLRLVKIIWGDESEHDFVEAPKTLRGIALISSLLVFPVLILPLVSIPTQSLISRAASSLF